MNLAQIIFGSNIKSKKILVSSVLILSISTLLLANLILKPKEPSKEFLYQPKKQDDLNRISNWHLANNPSAILPDNILCILKENNSNNRKHSLNCSSINIHKELLLNEDKYNSLRTLVKNNTNFWLNRDNTISFSPFIFNIIDAKISKDTQGLLGREIFVEYHFYPTQLSTEIDRLIEIFEIKNYQKNFEEIVKLIDPEDLKSKVTYRENKFGFYLPIKPLINY